MPAPAPAQRSTFPRGIAVEASGDLVVVDTGLDAVVRVDPVTGDRTIVSDAGTGTGPAFNSPRGIAVEASGDLVVVDSDLDAVFRVDPVTGDRSLVSFGNGFIVLGDANGDGVFNNLDIAAFVLALTNPAAYPAMFPDVDPDVVLDMNGDGVLTTWILRALLRLSPESDVTAFDNTPRQHKKDEPNSSTDVPIGRPFFVSAWCGFADQPLPARRFSR